MSCIHYKFKSSLDYNSVTFDGLHLSLGDLKKAISTQKRLRQGEFELEIINAQTGDVYKKSDELIAKNTSVIVSRVPVTKTNTNSTQRSWEAFKQECAKVKEQERQKMLELEEQKKVAEAVTVPASEMDKIKAVIDQSTKGFEPSSFQGRHPHAVPHDSYVCKRCGNKGHYITNCPNIKQEDRVVEPRVKRTTGIPSTMLTIVDDPLHPGALLTHHGQFAVPTVDVAGYRDTKKDQPPFSGENKEPEVEKKIIPKELLCHICEDLCVDAAIAPCCGTSFCDECLREELLESEDHQCPSCHETNVSPDRIVANRSMRIAVTNFLNDTGYTKVKRRRSSSTSGDQAPNNSIFPQPPKSPPQSIASTLNAPVTSAESISSLVGGVPSSAVSTQGTESSFSRPIRDNYQPRAFRGGHNSYRPWHRHENHNERPQSGTNWNETRPLNPLQSASFISATPPPPVMAAAAAAATQALQALVGQRLPPPHLIPPTFPCVPNFQQAAPQPHAPHLTGDLNAQRAASPIKKKTVDVFDSFADFTKKRSRTPELRSQSRSRSGSPPRRSSHSSYSPVKKGSHGRSPRRSLSRSHSRSRTGSFHRSRSRGRSPKRSRSQSPRRHRSGSVESRGLSELRSISPESITKSHSRSPRPILRSRSRSRSGSYKRYRSRSRSWSKTKKPRPRSYSPVSPRPFRRSVERSPRRSPLHSPRRTPLRSPRHTLSPRRSPARSPRRSPYRSPRSSLKSPGRSPLYSPIRSRSRRSFTPRQRSQSFSPRRRSPIRSKSRSPFGKRRTAYSRSRSPALPRRRSPSPYNKSRRSPSPYNKSGSYNKLRSPSPYQYRGRYKDGRGRERDSKYPRDDRRGGQTHPRHSPSRRLGGLNNAQPPPHPNAPAVANLPPVQLLPNMALPPPEEYFKHNPAGYEEFLRTFYAQFGNQANPWGGAPPGGHHPPPPGPSFGNSFPPNDQPNGPPSHQPHFGFPQDRRQPSWDSAGALSSRPRSLSPMGRTSSHSPKHGDKYRRDRPGFDNRVSGRDKERRFGGERNNYRRGGDYREDYQRQDDGRYEQRYEDRKWRGDHKDKRADEFKDRKFIPSEIKDKRGSRDDEKRGKEGDKTRTSDRWRDGRKSKEHLPNEKKKSPQNASKQNEKNKKGEDRKKKEEKENVENKNKNVVEDRQTETKTDESHTKAVDINDDAVSNTNVAPLKAEAQAKKESVPVGMQDNTQFSQDIVEKEKKVPGKKKVGTAGKKPKTKGANIADGEKKEKKIKKKKLTFGASEADNKGLKKKKLKRVVDYKSENTCTSEDAADPEKGTMSEPSPLKKAKVDSNNDGELTTDNVNHSKNDQILSNHVTESPEQAVPGDEGNALSSPQPEKTKSGLLTDLPELSKWEREEDFDIPVVEKTEEKPKEKSSLPRSVVDKAEMFIVGKPMKNSVVATSVARAEGNPEALEKQRELPDKLKDVIEKSRSISDKDKYNRDAAPNRPKERDTADMRDDRHRGVSDRHRLSQDERREDVSDRRKDYRDFRSKSPLYTSNRSGNSKDYRSKSPIHNKDHRAKSPNKHKDHRSKSPVHRKDYRSKSPLHNRDYRSKSPLHSNKDHRSKSPSERSRKVSIDSKKDHRERKSYDIQITVKGDRDRYNKKNSSGDVSLYHHSQRYQERGNFTEEDERSVVRSHSLERELKSKSHKRDKEDSNEKRKTEKDTFSKSKRKKSKDELEEKVSVTSSGDKKDNSSKYREDSAPHRSPRDLRHKIEEKTKSQNKSQNNNSHQRKLSVMDESEFVPDYEDTIAPETSNAVSGGDDKDQSVSPARSSSSERRKKRGKEGSSDEKSSDEDEGDDTKEGKKHKKSKKKHKHKEKKEKKEKHKHKKKKHRKNKDKEDDE